MPRLTYQPSWSSRAMRWATCSRVRAMFAGLRSGALSHGALLDPLLVAGALQHLVDEDAGGVDLVGVDLAHLDQLLALDDGGLRRHGHQGREVAGGLPEHAVAPPVRFPGADDGEVGVERLLEDVLLPVDGPGLLALGDLRPHAGGGEEAADAAAGGADPLGERALGVEVDLDLTGEELALELLVLADVG